jgi:hypothetical protein
MPYFHDDGTEFNPDLISKPSLCATCKKDNIPDQEIACNLTRMDQQGEDRFICFAYDSISGEAQTRVVHKDMEDYMDQKYGKHGEKRNAG